MMQETKTHKRCRKAIALFFILLLGVSYVLKPVHMATAHNNLSVQPDTQTKNQSVSTPHHHDCSICSFEFCSYIEQESSYLPTVYQALIQHLIVRVPAAISYYSSTFFPSQSSSYGIKPIRCKSCRIIYPTKDCTLVSADLLLLLFQNIDPLYYPTATAWGSFAVPGKIISVLLFYFSN